MFQCFYKHYLTAFIANFYICVSFQGILYWLLSAVDYSHDFLLFCISNIFLLYARPLFSGFSAPRREAKPPLAGKHQPVPSAMSPLLVGGCCLLSTRSSSKEEESEWDIRVRKGPGLPATPHFADFRPHPPFGMKLLKGPSSGCPWGVVLFLHRRGRLYWASEVWSATAILETQDAGVSGLVAGSIIQWCLKLPKGSSGLKTGHSRKVPLSGRRWQRFSQGRWACSLGLPRQSLSLWSLWPGMDSPSNFWSHIWKIWGQSVMCEVKRIGAKFADVAWELRRKGRDPFSESWDECTVKEPNEKQAVILLPFTSMESLEFRCCHLQGLKHRLQRFERSCSVGCDPPGGGGGERHEWWAVGGRHRIMVPTAGGTLRRFTSSHNSRVSKGACPGPCLPHTLWFCGTISSQSPCCILHGGGRIAFST